MKKLVLVIVSLLLLASVVPMGIGCSSGDTVEWIIATYSESNDTRTQTLEMFAAKVKELSDGKMKIRVSTSGDLYKGEDIYDNVANGNLELGLVPLVYYAENLPLTVMVMSQVWGSNINERVECFEAVLAQDVFQQEMKTAGTEILGWCSTGWMEFYFTDMPASIYALGNIPVVSPGGAVNTLVEQLGGTPVYKDTSEVALAIQTGTVKGVAIMPFDAYYGTGLYSLLDNVIMTYTIKYPFAIQMNTAAFNNLDTDLQKVVTDAWAATQQAGFDLVDTNFDIAFAALDADPDVNITKMTAAETATFHGMVNGIFEAGLKMYFPAEGYSGEAAAAPSAPDSAIVDAIQAIVAGVLAG